MLKDFRKYFFRYLPDIISIWILVTIKKAPSFDGGSGPLARVEKGRGVFELSIILLARFCYSFVLNCLF